MRVIRIENDEEVLVGAEIMKGVIFRGIIDEPKVEGNAGGPFAGRILVTDANGNDIQPLPFQYNLKIVP